MDKSIEDEAREMLFEIGVDNPGNFTASDLTPLANLIADSKTGISQEGMREVVKGASQLASIVSNYYLELKKCGFGDHQALTAAVWYQHTILTMGAEE